MISKRSSVHLRTLSRLGVDLEKDVVNIDIPEALTGDTETQDVAGLSGRLRLQRMPSSKQDAFTSRNWMDRQRQHLQAYEYLCHIGEAKEWIEGCLGHSIAAIVDLEEQLRNGVVLAQLAKIFVPDLVPRIFDAAKLQFRHSDNINRFFKFVDRVGLPENFRFELTDLYEKKNIPKVIYCIHALSFVLVNAGLARRIGNLIGKLEFTDEEIRNTQKSLDATGVSMPNFKNVGSAVAGELEIPPEVVESESEFLHRVWTENLTSLIAIQAQMRGATVRRYISSQLQRLEVDEAALVDLQARAQGFLVRKQYYENADTYKKINAWAIELQINARRYLAQSTSATHRADLQAQNPSIVSLQMVIRGRLARKRYKESRNIISQVNSPILDQLQSIIRGAVVRRSLRMLDNACQKEHHTIVACQATARGMLARRSFDRLQAHLELNEDEIVCLQAGARSFLVRSKMRKQAMCWKDHESTLAELQARCRTLLMQRKCLMLQQLFALERNTIVDLQASCLGMLVRIEVNSKLIALTSSAASVILLQALARGTLIRKSYWSKLQHYKKNMERVIKVQSFVRSRQQGAAYKSLTLDKDPPVSTIKNFVHLLNDSNFDFEEEVAMEQVRQQIVQSVRQNEAAEEHIEQMDIKIALLVKQAIKIDEVIQHQKRLDYGLGLVKNDCNPFDLKALNVNARRQLENYQRFFYILQTQPVYLARLFSCLEVQNMPDKLVKSLETFVMILYGYAQKKREEYFLLMLIRSSIIKGISMTDKLINFTQGEFLWHRIFANYAKGGKESGYLKTVLHSIVSAVVEDDFLDLESDPLIIYNTITRDEEMRTGQRSQRPPEVSQEYAIQDPDTRVMFIKHLRDLRDLTERTIDSIKANIASVPFGVRYLARESLRAMEEHLPEESMPSLNRIVAHLLFDRYLGPALIAPDQASIVDFSITPEKRRNLAAVSKMLKQVTSGRLFEEGNYLQPLNEFISKSIDRMSNIYQEIVQVPDSETFYNITELDDVIATKRPILYIKASDIFSIHSLIHNELESVAPEIDGPLHNVVQRLGPPPTRAEDMMIMSISANTEIALTLDPKAIDVDDPDAEERALFMQTKRYLLYIIRIQSGPTLLDILVEPITEADEERWNEILQEENSEQEMPQRPAYYQPVHQDICQMSYPVMKRECLENIVKLEQLGWITRDNHYQELLNRIADDIRSQNRRRIERQHELSSARNTLENLTQKRSYLDSQLKSYNDYIEQAMMSLQTKKGKRKSVLPFTKQYFHMRDLQKSGKVPKFGSRKYSAAKLYYKGILIAFANEQPPFEKVDMTISSDQIGMFTIQATYQGSTIPGAMEAIQVDDLLQAQYNKLEIIDVFQGKAKMHVSLLVNLVFKHFFSQ